MKAEQLIDIDPVFVHWMAVLLPMVWTWNKFYVLFIVL